jgi:peptide chain release factor 2
MTTTEQKVLWASWCVEEVSFDAKLIEILTKKKKDFCPDFWNNARSRTNCKKLWNKKKWIEDYDKAVTMTDELELAYEFYREGNSQQKN